MRKSFYAIIIALTLCITAGSCKKNKPSPPPTPPAGALLLAGNVHIIDSTQWILSPYSNSINYWYTFTPSTPNVDVQIGDILVGSTNGGYIRKVTAISISSGYYELQTTQAYMSDVFKSGTFSFQIPINDPSQSSPGVTRSLSNSKVYHSTGFNVNVLQGQFNIQPSYFFSFSFDSVAGLTNFQMSTTNTSISSNLNIGITGSMPYAWGGGGGTTLASYSQTNIQQVQAWTPTGNVLVPVVIQLNQSFIANASGGTPGSSVNEKLIWTGNTVFTGGLQYQGGQWQSTCNVVGTNSFTFDTFAFGFNGTSNLSFLSKLSSVFYGIGGPQFTAGISGIVSQSQQNAGSSYDCRTDAWTIATDAQTVSPIFGHNISTFTQSCTADSVFFQTPYKLTKISGDNDTGNIIQTLPEPLVVKVTDSNGQPVSNIGVSFSVTHGGGTISASNQRTDQNGQAQVTWTLGPVMGNQNVTVIAHGGYTSQLAGSPAVFNATGQ